MITLYSSISINSKWICGTISLKAHSNSKSRDYLKNNNDSGLGLFIINKSVVLAALFLVGKLLIPGADRFWAEPKRVKLTPFQALIHKVNPGIPIWWMINRIPHTKRWASVYLSQSMTPLYTLQRRMTKTNLDPLISHN